MLTCAYMVERMTDLPASERLAKHRAVAAWLEYQWRQEMRIVADLEQQVAEQERRRAKARAGLNFKIEPERAGHGARLHRGDCATYPDEHGLIDAGDAVIALRDPGTPIAPCQVCNPVAALRNVRVPLEE